MKIKWRGLICLALVSIFSCSSIAPIYALEESSSETETENGTVEEEPPEEEIGFDPQTIEEDETQKNTQEIQDTQQDPSDAPEVPTDPETEAPEENVQAQEENEPVETTVSKDGLELTGLDLEDIEIQLEPDQAKTVKQQLEEDGEEIDNAKAWSFSSPLTGSYEATFELDDASLSCQLYDISGTKTKLLADANDFDGNKVHFEGTDIAEIALVQKASEKNAKKEVQPRATTARITFNLQDVNATSFTQLRQETVNIGSSLLNIWPSETEVPLTKTVGGTLYMLTFWYDNSSMTTKSIIGNVHGNANFYATYIPARRVTIQNIVNSTDSGALNQTYPITLTATTSSTTGTSGVIVENKGQRYPQSPLIVDFNANETVTMYVPDGATLNAAQTDLSFQGFAQYILKNNTLTQGLSSGNIVISANSNPFMLINSKAPYVFQPAYTYGQLPDGTYVGLGQAQANAGPMIAVGIAAANINYLDFNPTITYPDQMTQNPADSSIAFTDGYPNITYQGQTYRYTASNSANANAPGYYTINSWDSLRKVASIDQGANNFYHSSNTANYRLDGTLRLNLYNNVTFKLKDVGSNQFTDVANHAPIPLSVQDTLSAAAPSMAANKTVNGLTYRFTGWHSNEALTNAANMNSTISQDTILYGAYVPVMQTLNVTSQNADGNLDADPNMAFTYRITITPSSNETITTSNNVRSLGNNVYEVTLSSGQNATLTVPDGSLYTVEQTNPNSMYEPSWQAVNANGTNSGTNVSTSRQQVVGSSSFTFTNRRYSPPPTDFGTSSPAPYVLLGAIIGISLLLLKRRKQ